MSFPRASAENLNYDHFILGRRAEENHTENSSHCNMYHSASFLWGHLSMNLHLDMQFANYVIS